LSNLWKKPNYFKYLIETHKNIHEKNEKSFKLMDYKIKNFFLLKIKKWQGFDVLNLLDFMISWCKKIWFVYCANKIIHQSLIVCEYLGV